MRDGIAPVVNPDSAALHPGYVLDYEGVVSAAYSLLTKDSESLDSFGWAPIELSQLERVLSQFPPYRAVLVDEVQDLSQLEVAMIGILPSPHNSSIANIDNGLFLVGDGAQTIYNKGFVLKHCGISISNRSFILKKNYRNSKEIMSSSYTLIEKYEFADIDEDNIDNPTEPDLPSKTGEKPFIVKCKTEIEEITFVSKLITGLISDYQAIKDTTDYPEICVIGLNASIRKNISKKLQLDKINCTELKQSVSIESKDSVAISTIESAKGHEFKYIFIVGVTEGLIPQRYSKDEDISREASRLYVAMTRAQENLYISYNINNNNLVDGQNSVTH